MIANQRNLALVAALALVGCNATSELAVDTSSAPLVDMTAQWSGPASMPPDMIAVPEAEPVFVIEPQPKLRIVEPRRSAKVESGTVLVHGGGPIHATTMQQFASLCGKDGPMILIPTAAEAAESERYRERVRQPWLRSGLREVVVLHARDRDEAYGDAFSEPLRTASCAWFGGGKQGRLEDRYVGTPVEKELHALLSRGGAIGGSSAGSAIMSRVMIHHGNPDPVEGTGFGVLPGIIIDQHFLAREREPRLITMLERHPDLIGFGIDEETALLVQGDRWRVIGDSVVRRCTQRLGCADLPAGASGRLSAVPE